MLTDGTGSLLTANRCESLEQEFKKLHSVKVMSYTPPACNVPRGIAVGGLNWYVVAKNVSSAAMSLVGEDTTTDKDHVRPPDPDEEDRSIIGESHGPTVAGADTTTTGEIGDAGAAIRRVAEGAVLHAEQIDGAKEHSARILDPTRVKSSPTLTMDPLCKVIRTFELSSH